MEIRNNLELRLALHKLDRLEALIIANEILREQDLKPVDLNDTCKSEIQEAVDELNTNVDDEYSKWEYDDIKVESDGEIFEWKDGGWKPTGIYLGRDSWA